MAGGYRQGVLLLKLAVPGLRVGDKEFCRTEIRKRPARSILKTKGWG